MFSSYYMNETANFHYHFGNGGYGGGNTSSIVSVSNICTGQDNCLSVNGTGNSMCYIIIGTFRNHIIY